MKIPTTWLISSAIFGETHLAAFQFRNPLTSGVAARTSYRHKMDPDHIPQFPPPPYSETSEPGPLTPATSQADNALSASLSSVDEAIYTPSYSPTVSVHQGQASRDDFDLISSSSASAYFESRPPCRFVSGSPEIYRITITARTGPQDLPYPTHFGTLDCMAQDVRIVGFLKYYSSSPPQKKNI